MKLEYCSATLSPLYPTHKPSITQSKTYPGQYRAKHTQKFWPSQSRYLPLNLKLFPHKYSHFASQSRYHSTQILSFSLSISRSASVSVSVSLSVSLLRCCSRSRSPLTRYVSLSLHVQLVGIFVCKFVIFCIVWFWVLIQKLIWFWVLINLVS